MNIGQLFDIVCDPLKTPCWYQQGSYKRKIISLLCVGSRKFNKNMNIDKLFLIDKAHPNSIRTLSCWYQNGSCKRKITISIILVFLYHICFCLYLCFFLGIYTHILWHKSTKNFTIWSVTNMYFFKFIMDVVSGKLNSF